MMKALLGLLLLGAGVAHAAEMASRAMSTRIPAIRLT